MNVIDRHASQLYYNMTTFDLVCCVVALWSMRGEHHHCTAKTCQCFALNYTPICTYNHWTFRRGKIPLLKSNSPPTVSFYQEVTGLRSPFWVSEFGEKVTSPFLWLCGHMPHNAHYERHQATEALPSWRKTAAWPTVSPNHRLSLVCAGDALVLVELRVPPLGIRLISLSVGGVGCQHDLRWGVCYCLF